MPSITESSRHGDPEVSAAIALLKQPIESLGRLLVVVNVIINWWFLPRLPAFSSQIRHNTSVFLISLRPH